MEQKEEKIKNQAQENPTTIVMVANNTGHSTLQLTKQETIEIAKQDGGKWIFADGRMLDNAGLAEVDWNTIGVVQLVPSLVGGSEEEVRVTVQIADATGHSTLQLTQDEAVSKAAQSADTWLFVDGQMVDAAGLADADWASVNTVQMMPQLVGGEQKKILVVGAGGIGSSLLELVAPAASRCGLSCSITIMDDDIVEATNLGHQRFSKSEVGMLKVDALSQRYASLEGVSVKALSVPLRNAEQLQGFDLIIVAVDRPEPRSLVHESKTKWLDLRCSGDGWLLLDSTTDSDIVTQLSPVHEPTSCQLEGAIAAGNIEFGFAAVAAAGAQWVIQKMRIESGARTSAPMAQMNSLTMGNLPMPRAVTPTPAGVSI